MSHTHYCAPNQGAYSDCHMHDVIEPAELDNIVEKEVRTNVVYVDGYRYYLDEITEIVTSDGHRYARLAPLSKSYDFMVISDNAMDLSGQPF